MKKQMKDVRMARRHDIEYPVKVLQSYDRHHVTRKHVQSLMYRMIEYIINTLVQP